MKGVRSRNHDRCHDLNRRPPCLSIEASGPLARARTAVVLGLLNPLAALVSFLDPGARDAARKDETCWASFTGLWLANQGDYAERYIDGLLAENTPLGLLLHWWVSQ